MAGRHLNKHSVLMGYIFFSFSIRYEGVSFVAIIYTDSEWIQQVQVSFGYSDYLKPPPR